MDDSKMYVVIAVLCVILLGIAVYLFLLDKKVSSLQKDMEKLDRKEE